MGWPIDNERKDVSHPFMTMILTCVTMVGWADVPDSDRGDFRPDVGMPLTYLVLIQGLSVLGSCGVCHPHIIPIILVF